MSQEVAVEVLMVMDLADHMQMMLALVDMGEVVMVVLERLIMLFKTPEVVAVDLKENPILPAHVIMVDMVLPVLFSLHIPPNK